MWFIFSNKASNDIKCLMPRNMCWDPVSNDDEVWLFDGGLYLDPFTAMHCCCAVVSEDVKTTQAGGPQTWSLEGGPTRCQGVLEHWLNLHRNIPLRACEVVKYTIMPGSRFCLGVGLLVLVETHTTASSRDAITELTLLVNFSTGPQEIFHNFSWWAEMMGNKNICVTTTRTASTVIRKWSSAQIVEWLKARATYLVGIPA